MKRGPKSSSFALADAVDAEEFVGGGRAQAGHVAQAGVAEDDVGRDAALGGDFVPQGAEAVEEIAVYAFP